MSAVVRQLVPHAARMPARTAPVSAGSVYSRLRLVGPDERAADVEWVECLEAPACRTMRLSRRGRLVITLAVTAALVALVVVLGTSVNAAAARIDHATTVLAGQTLSEVAAAQLPSLPIDEAVARIQLANDLNTSQVHAGQSLLIPVVR